MNDTSESRMRIRSSPSATSACPYYRSVNSNSRNSKVAQEQAARRYSRSSSRTTVTESESRTSQASHSSPTALAPFSCTVVVRHSRKRHRCYGSSSRRGIRLRRNGDGYNNSLLMLVVMLACLCASARVAGLVIEEPFQESFRHVPAMFGPDVLSMDPPIESRPLVSARPRNACSPLGNAGQMAGGAIALVERGACNFTTKVLHAQRAGASAVVVTDTDPKEEGLLGMSGLAENTRGIEIPAVLVSRVTGERLWSKRFWMPPAKFKASINATGHVMLRPVRIGTLETISVYFLLSMLLLGFSGICGLLFALAFTWYQRGYRSRALRKLKSFTFRQKRPPPTHGDHVTVSSVNKASASSSSRLDGNGMRAEDDMCAICLDMYEEGEVLTGLPCRHSFHTQCIRPWLSGKSGLCPICKGEAFSRKGWFLAVAAHLETAFAELVTLCTENLAVLGLFFLTSVAVGVFAAKVSVAG